MHLQIITPEKVIIDKEVDSVAVPGKHGEFQMLNMHAPIVSTLAPGNIKIFLLDAEKVDLDSTKGALIWEGKDEKVALCKIKSGVLEMNQNKAIILAEI